MKIRFVAKLVQVEVVEMVEVEAAVVVLIQTELHNIYVEECNQ